MPAKPNILVLGPSGFGKTMSLANLPWKITAFLDCECKGFPFLGIEKAKMYEEANNKEQADTFLMNAFQSKDIQVVVIDSLTKYFDFCYERAKATMKGYDVFNFFNACIAKLFSAAKASAKVLVFTAIDEIVYVELPDGGRVSRQRCAVKGKEWEGKIEKEFLVVVVADVVRNDNKVVHVFRTATDGVSPAKCPPWLNAPAVMPNDIALLLNPLLAKAP